MTNEEKELLLKDICCRLPYNVKVHAKYTDPIETIEVDGIVKMVETDSVGIEVINDFGSAWTCVHIDNVKPYLFPMSSMTGEQRREYVQIANKCGTIASSQLTGMTVQDWFNKNRLDYRGLIPMGLAIDATGLGIY